jgi:predicted nucleotidyltransferase
MQKDWNDMTRANIDKIALDKKWRKVLITILEPYPYTFFIFGSRADHTARKYSDIDILVPKEAPINVVYNIKEACEDSSLPYVVDVIYEPLCSRDFIDAIKKKYIPLKKEEE